MSNLPTTTGTETVPISPEFLEVANCYLANGLDITKVANDLDLPPEFISQTVNRREVRDYINNVWFSIGFNNRHRMRSALDSVIRKKFQELEESETGSTKDIADLLALSHKMTMDQLAMELKILEAQKDGPKSQVNVQINESGGARYASLVERLIEANK